MELLRQAVEMMIHGMGVVFFFLALMMLCVQLMSWLLARTQPEGPQVGEGPGNGVSARQPAGASEEEGRRAAVLAAAVHHQRSTGNSGNKMRTP